MPSGPDLPPRVDPRLFKLLERLPKVDLHLHLVGAMRARTLAELAAKHAIELPKPVEALYAFSAFEEFINVLRLAATVLRTREDFARVMFETLEDAYRRGNLKHAEVMFNPQYHYPCGIRYPQIVEGLRDGIAKARAEYGVSGLLIASIDREIDPARALEIMQHIVAYRCDEVVGVGLDGPEGAGPPHKFAAAYRLAGRAGLKRTAHVCEDNQPIERAPPEHYRVCTEVLHCDRLDHGYNLLTDPATLARARDDGLFFNICPMTSAARNRERRLQSIRQMQAAGLRITVNTDDPAMFGTDIAQAHDLLFANLGWGVREAMELGLAGIEASWADPARKLELRREFLQDFRVLTAEPGLDDGASPALRPMED
jgi:adenosine deaminase